EIRDQRSEIRDHRSNVEVVALRPPREGLSTESSDLSGVRADALRDEGGVNPGGSTAKEVAVAGRQVRRAGGHSDHVSVLAVHRLALLGVAPRPGRNGDHHGQQDDEGGAHDCVGVGP
ncbi:hypothetical protein PENTCL1PPCAC_3797, partial [Pristionchus entomophagus]